MYKYASYHRSRPKQASQLLPKCLKTTMPQALDSGWFSFLHLVLFPVQITTVYSTTCNNASWNCHPLSRVCPACRVSPSSLLYTLPQTQNLGPPPPPPPQCMHIQSCHKHTFMLRTHTQSLSLSHTAESWCNSLSLPLTHTHIYIKHMNWQVLDHWETGQLFFSFLNMLINFVLIIKKHMV